MSLQAIFQSEIGESDVDNLIVELFMVEIVDKSLPYPHLGGFRGIRTVDVNLINEDWVEFYDWEYECENTFEGLLPSGKVRWGMEMDTLRKYAKGEYDMIRAGERFADFSKYFDNQDAPYAVSDRPYMLNTAEQVQEFRQTLNRKFGADKQLEMERCFDGILKDLERPAMFHISPIPNKKAKVAISYEAWGLFS